LYVDIFLIKKNSKQIFNDIYLKFYIFLSLIWKKKLYEYKYNVKECLKKEEDLIGIVMFSLFVYFKSIFEKH